MARTPDPDLSPFDAGWSAVVRAITRLGGRDPHFNYDGHGRLYVGTMYDYVLCAGRADVTVTPDSIAILEAGAACIRNMLGEITA